MKTYTLATEHKESGAVVYLENIPMMTLQQATQWRDKVLALLPETVLYVINTKAL